MIDVGAGIVDPDYRGNIQVLLFNHGDTPFHFNIGDRIAQLVLSSNLTPETLLVPFLSTTTRATAGFGSTGGHNSLACIQESTP